MRRIEGILTGHEIVSYSTITLKTHASYQGNIPDAVQHGSGPQA